MTRFIAIAAALLLSIAPAQAQTFNDAQKSEIEAMVKDYILNNPEVLIQSFENHRVAQEERLQREANEAAKELLGALSESPFPAIGPKDADVTMVEFMDYNCGYCKKAYEEINAILKEDKNIRVHFVEMPILGPTSLEAAKWALAAHKQGKYFEFHSALMKHQGPKNDSVLESKAKEVKLDVKKLKEDKEGDDIKDMLEMNMSRANMIGITGTPGFIIGGEVVRGYLTLDQMKEVIAAARSGKTTSDQE